MKNIAGAGIGIISLCFMMLLLLAGCSEYSSPSFSPGLSNKESSAAQPAPPEKIYSQGIYEHVEYKTSDECSLYSIIYYDGGGTFIAQQMLSIPASKGEMIKVVDNDAFFSGLYKVVRVDDKKEE